MHNIMYSKYLKNFSIIFSIIFLLVLTFLITFTFFISQKPLKLNFLNFFDRESTILKKKKIDEIGDIYISFNKVTKKFEFLIENLLVKDFFFPDIKITLDLSFDSFFYTTLKLYDGEISLFQQKDNLDTQHNNILENISKLESIRFFKKFSDIEVVNNEITIINKNNEKFKYVLDLKFNKENIFGLITEFDNADNELSFSINKESNFLAKVRANNFNIDFIEPFLKNNLIMLSDLKISGFSEIEGDSLDKIDTFNFDFLLDGKVVYSTNFEKKEIFLKKTLLKVFLITIQLILLLILLKKSLPLKLD